MNILFLHRSFPGQFRYLASALSLDPANTVVFITEDDKNQIEGIQKFVYTTDYSNAKKCDPYLYEYEDAVIQGQAAAGVAMNLKQQGFVPDIIVGFASWGSELFMKDIYPDVPLLTYFEWFGNPEGADVGFDGQVLTEDARANLRSNNFPLLASLNVCDAGMSPTHWQKKQFPKEYQDKIKVIHDGIDVGLYVPDDNTKFMVKDKNLELTAKDEVITYGTRGMEPYRGFPEFMQAVEKLLVARPNAHFVIAGDDNVHYGEQLKSGTYKELMLGKLKLDMSRVHFVGTLPFAEYAKLLQVSAAHVYLTYPFVLSWSILDAMSVGCCIVASDTAPVTEVIEDDYNGLLVDFFDVNQLAKKIEYALDNKEKMKEIRANARQTVIDKYSLEVTLPQQIQYIYSLLAK